MVDFWADRIALNPSYAPSKTAGTSMPSPTMGTLDNQNDDGEKWGLPDAGGQSASTTDISNNVKEIPCPMNNSTSWGGIDNPYPSSLPGTAR